MTPPGPLRLASAGVGVVGVCFGMARYGYGLLLPSVRSEYGFSSAVLGLVGTCSYVAYLAATALTGVFAQRVGARACAVVAALVAATGMAAAGLSRSPALFVAGILVAGASAGLAFAPFSDATREIPAAIRGRVLSAINCGTGYGVALAAPIAIVAGTSWRGAWLAFAGVAVLAAGWAWHVLPAQSGVRATAPRRRRGAWPRRALPLLAGAVLVGLGSSVFWTFAVAHLVDTGALSTSASRAFLGVVGVASVLATVAGDLVRRLGAARSYVAFTLTEAVALALLAVAASSPLGAGLLAGTLGLSTVLLIGAGCVAVAATLAPR